MYLKNFLAYILILIASLPAFARDKDLLSGRYSLPVLQQHLIPQSEWTPFPKLDDRDGWAKADQEALKAAIPAAEAYLDYVWPSIPATSYLPANWQLYDRARVKTSVLRTLMMGEIAENKGRFIDQIVNGIWAICEDSWWGTPAHIPQSPAYAGMMDVANPVVELWGSDAGALFAWADYFFAERFDAISPQIRKRMYDEIDHRLFKPFMEKDHWWMGVDSDGKGPNNWNPWICANWINTVLLLVRDDAKRAAMIAYSLKILDEFLNPYAQDGGCDEGPGYWGAAGAMLYSSVALLNLASNDAFSYVYDHPKIKNMGKYIYRAQINRDYFLNFADANPIINIDVGIAYRYGRDIGDQDMMRFAAYYRRPRASTGSNRFFPNLFSLFGHEELLNAPQGLPLPGDVWFPDLQVMVARDKNNSTDGFYLAAKGGHNAESHNHNDVGMFVVYYDGQPLLIDAGRATYTSRTLNNRDIRYEIWMHRSDFHNLPTVNGFDQRVGIEHTASDVSYKADKSRASLTMDLTKAYPAEAAIRKFTRTVQLNRSKHVQIVDNIDLEKANTITNHLLTCFPAEVKKPGEVLIHYQPKDGQRKDFIIEYNPGQMEASVEKVKLEEEEDAAIEQNWGDVIHRIKFKVITPKTKDTFTFRIKPA